MSVAERSEKRSSICHWLNSKFEVQRYNPEGCEKEGCEKVAGLISTGSCCAFELEFANDKALSKTVNNKISIMVIDDQSVVRQGFVALINTVADMEVIAEGINGQQAIDLYRQHKPDVTLIDLRMPVLAGVEAITAIRREFPEARLIVLTTYDGDEDIYRSLQAGARGYLLKDVFFEELETAIRSVHAGARHIPASIAERLVERMAGSDLTGREMEVLELIVRGQSNKEIGASLSISEATVKSHINNILSKLGVTDRTQAATTALQRGLVHLR